MSGVNGCCRIILSSHTDVIFVNIFRGDGAVGGPYVVYNHEYCYSGVLCDSMSDRVGVGIRECSRDEILETIISVIIEVVGVDLSGMDTFVFYDS